jgi:hypothetical protein
MVGRRGCKILWPRNIEPPPPYILSVGIQNIMGIYIVGSHGKKEGVQKIMAAKYCTLPSYILKGDGHKICGNL